MIIELEILKGILFGVYFIFLATLLSGLELAVLWRFVPRREDRLHLFVYTSCFSYVGMVVGFLLGFTKTPGTVGTVLPAVLTFITGVFGFMLMRESGRYERLLLATMVMAFSISLTLFIFVGLRLQILLFRD